MLNQPQIITETISVTQSKAIPMGTSGNPDIISQEVPRGVYRELLGLIGECALTDSIPCLEASSDMGKCVIVVDRVEKHRRYKQSGRKEFDHRMVFSMKFWVWTMNPIVDLVAQVEESRFLKLDTLESGVKFYIDNF